MNIVAMKQSYGSWLRVVGCLLASLVLCTAQRASTKSLNLGGALPARYLAQVASFGNPLYNSKDNPTLKYNLMLPPDVSSNPWLCEYPAIFANLTDNRTASIKSKATELYTTPVALVVSIDACSPEQKAKVALEIQQRIIGELELLIIYSTDPRSNTLNTLMMDNTTNKENYNSIGVLHVPYRAAAGILTRMRMNFISNKDPRLLLNDNDEWSFPIQISNYSGGGGNDDDYDRGSSRSSGGSGKGGISMYWFRFVLFSLLVLTPCCRAGYLWFAGGGRICFRRDENGRIVGLRYVSPSPTWLMNGRFRGHHGGEAAENRRAGTLTEEQFNSLPEIEYKTIASHYDEDKEDGNENGEATNDVEQNGVEMVTLSDKKETPEKTDADTEEPEIVLPPAGETDDAADSMEKGESATPENGDATPPPVCRSTMCSICIDDFEAGEKIVLLPICQHGFHRDCIHPWLTERQGCCPFCKTPAFGETTNTDASDEEQASPGNSATESPEEQNNTSNETNNNEPESPADVRQPPSPPRDRNTHANEVARREDS